MAQCSTQEVCHRVCNRFQPQIFVVEVGKTSRNGLLTIINLLSLSAVGWFLLVAFPDDYVAGHTLSLSAVVPLGLHSGLVWHCQMLTLWATHPNNERMYIYKNLLYIVSPRVPSGPRLLEPRPWPDTCRAWDHLGSLGSRVVPRPQRSGPIEDFLSWCIAHNVWPVKACLSRLYHPERRRRLAGSAIVDGFMLWATLLLPH